jgi:hypothetical protein
MKLIVNLKITNMKRILTLILFVFIGMQFILSQEKAAQLAEPAKKTTETQQLNAAQPVQAAPATPKTIAWNETIHDFGKLVQNDPASVTFTFTNTGKEPVVITAARSSCGCTVAEYTKEPVKPGASGTVQATYNSARAGAFNKSVTVTFEANPTPNVLTIKGMVEAKPVESAPVNQ